MAVTTPQQEYQRLRSYLNPALRGKNTDAILNALATASGYLVNSVAQVNENLFITTASGTYLDALLAQYGITRPSSVGLSDDVFRQIGIQVKNRKIVRDLMNNILDAIFGDKFVKATNSCMNIEPYDLADEDTLIVNFDQGVTVTIPFSASSFANIATATAQEVANAIVTYLTSIGVNGSATTQNNGNGNYVQLISNTIGPASSVTVLGGSAQNILLFPEAVAAGGNASTQWTLSQAGGGNIKFTWSGGANPNLGKVIAGNYVNIYGGGFASSANVGTYTIVTSVGGAIHTSYFEIYNPTGTTGIITQGSDTAVLFYNPIKETLASNMSYAAIYQTQAGMLQIFLPAVTKVVRRGREGSAHLHDPPNGNYNFQSQPNSGDIFSITSTQSVVAGVNFVIGATIADTVQNMVAAINSAITGLVAIANTSDVEMDNLNVVYIQNDSLSNALTITYTGSASIAASGPLGSQISLEPNQPGPYIYDKSQPFTVGAIHTELTQIANAETGNIIFVENSSDFPNSQGYIILGYGSPDQEGPIPYLVTPSDGSIFISPAYTLQNNHPIGTDVRIISLKAPVQLALDGSDFEFFLVDDSVGRVYCQQLLQSVAAAGISIVFTILYPSDEGLGKFGTPYSEVAEVYGA